MKSTVSCKAFSIIEVMTALLVLVVGIYSAAELFLRAQRTAALTDTRIIGYSLAQLKLEELRASGNQLRPLLNSGVKLTLPASGVGLFEQNPGYSWQAMVATSAMTTSALSIDVLVYRAGVPSAVAKASGIKFMGQAKDQIAGIAK